MSPLFPTIPTFLITSHLPLLPLFLICYSIDFLGQDVISYVYFTFTLCVYLGLNPETIDPVAETLPQSHRLAMETFIQIGHLCYKIENHFVKYYRNYALHY